MPSTHARRSAPLLPPTTQLTELLAKRQELISKYQRIQSNPDASLDEPTSRGYSLRQSRLGGTTRAIRANLAAISRLLAQLSPAEAIAITPAVDQARLLPEQLALWRRRLIGHNGPPPAPVLPFPKRPRATRARSHLGRILPLGAPIPPAEEGGEARLKHELAWE